MLGINNKLAFLDFYKKCAILVVEPIRANPERSGDGQGARPWPTGPVAKPQARPIICVVDS